MVNAFALKETTFLKYKMVFDVLNKNTKKLS